MKIEREHKRDTLALMALGLCFFILLRVESHKLPAKISQDVISIVISTFILKHIFHMV